MNTARIFLILLLCFIANGLYAFESKADSLYFYLNKESDQEKKVDFYNELAYEFLFSDSLKSLALLKKAHDNAMQLNYESGKARALNYYGIYFWGHGENKKALYFIFQSLAIREKAGLDCEKPESWMGIGTVYYSMGEIEKSLSYFLKALELYQKCNDQDGISSALNNLGAVYNVTSENRKALQCYLSSVSLAEKNNDKHVLFNAYNNIGNTYLYMGNSDSAIYFLGIALQIAEGENSMNQIALALSNLASIYGQSGNHEKALEFLLKSVALAEKAGDEYTLATAYESLAVAYAAIDEYEKAYEIYRKFYALREKSRSNESLRIVHEMEAKYNDEKSQKEIAFLRETDVKNRALIFRVAGILILVLIVVFFLFILYRSKKKTSALLQFKNLELERLSIVARETENVILIMDADGKLEWVNESFEKLNAISLAELKKLKGETIYDISNNPNIREIIERSIKDKKPYSYESLNITSDGRKIWESSTLTPIFDENGKLKKIIIIDSDTTERKHTEELIKEKNKEITDSINYAKRLQDAILPSDNFWYSILPDSFILYKPKDIVAGDFYFLEKSRDQIIFAAADCTGHGVPGAMVSVVCANALNRAVKEFNFTDAGQILDKVRELVIETFSRNDEQVKDGMDISLCAISPNSLREGPGVRLNWAGANNPLWIIRKDSLEIEELKADLSAETSSEIKNSNGYALIEVKADKQPIGNSFNANPFKSHNTDLEKGDSIYIFTDGFADQFGGEGGKKYKYATMKKFLLSIQTVSMEQQNRLLSEEFEKWKGSLEQLDDVCIIGVKI